MPPVKNAPRGHCATCKRDFALNRDGTLHAHSRLGQNCTGSRRPPKPAATPGDPS